MVHGATVAPAEVSAANVEPAATLPMLDCTAAASECFATPCAVKPSIDSTYAYMARSNYGGALRDRLRRRYFSVPTWRAASDCAAHPVHVLLEVAPGTPARHSGAPSPKRSRAARPPAQAGR